MEYEIHDATEDVNMGQALPERRNSLRIQVDGPIRYRPIDSHDFQPGQIENISSNGALLWISEELPLDSEIIVRVGIDSTKGSWSDMVATLLYKLPEKKDSFHGYGCSIELA